MRCLYKLIKIKQVVISLFLTIFLVRGIIAFQSPGLGSYLIRATASYSLEGLEAAACKPVLFRT